MRGIREGAGSAHVYTLTVARDHDFFAGTAGVLSHPEARPPSRASHQPSFLLSTSAPTPMHSRRWAFPRCGAALLLRGTAGWDRPRHIGAYERQKPPPADARRRYTIVVVPIVPLGSGRNAVYLRVWMI